MNKERINGLRTREKELRHRMQELDEYIKSETDDTLIALDKEELKYTKALHKVVKAQIKVTKPHYENAVFKDMKLVEFFHNHDGNGIYFVDNQRNEVLLRSIQEPLNDDIAYIDLEGVRESDFDGLLFDFDGNDLSKTIEVIKDRGVRLIPKNGHPIFLPFYLYDRTYCVRDFSVVLAHITDEKCGLFDYDEWEVKGVVGEIVVSCD